MKATSAWRAGKYPVTPDGRYFVVRGRLWRCSNPNLAPTEHDRLVSELMAARRDIGASLRSGDDTDVLKARAKVDAAKRALGERGPPWWDDGAPDYNRRAVRNTVYAAWFENLEEG
jgi:hypothetical protein